MNIIYPEVELLSPEAVRPLWSVMIPTYNGTQYLEQTLRSVLTQDFGPETMQIEVIDDCSTKDDPEKLVQEVGRGRITFTRQACNVGLIENWNSCIDRAQGRWVHILHQDDIVLPGFYRQLKNALDQEAAIGAFFCRHAFIDSDGHWQGISNLESKTAGVLSNWIEQIAVIQRIQFPSIVVKRSVYEQLGGFCADASYAADWEMWKRISATYSVWYEPQILACYRMHSSSETSRMARSAVDIVGMRRAIQISEAYLPKDRARQLSRKARENSALYAVNTARRMLRQKSFTPAIAQIKEALKCSTSLRVIRSLSSLLKEVMP